MATQNVPTCNICVEKINQTTRKTIECPRCSFTCCKACAKTYITDSEHYLQCMNCKETWERIELLKMFGKSFMSTTYRDVRREMLYERESRLFPGTQSVIEADAEIEKLRKEIDGLDEKYAKKREEQAIPITRFRASEEVMKVSDAFDKLFILQNALVAEYNVLDNKKRREKQSLKWQIQTLNNEIAHGSRRAYLVNCSKVDCKGTLGSVHKTTHGHYKCSLCSDITCVECRSGVPGAEEDHICDPETKLSLKLVEETSKPCPGCNIFIYKIEGCDVMFCTSCHVSFSWDTKEILNKRLHNPHLTEWLRQTNGGVVERERNDIPCGREITRPLMKEINAEIDIWQASPDLTGDQRRAFNTCIDRLQKTYKYYRRLINQVIFKLGTSEFSHRSNQAARLKFLRGAMTEKEFKTEIQRADKIASRKMEYLQIALAYRDSCTDILWECYENRKTKDLESWIESGEQSSALLNYMDSCLQEIHTSYVGKSNRKECLSLILGFGKE